EQQPVAESFGCWQRGQHTSHNRVSEFARYRLAGCLQSADRVRSELTESREHGLADAAKVQRIFVQCLCQSGGGGCELPFEFRPGPPRQPPVRTCLEHRFNQTEVVAVAMERGVRLRCGTEQR